MQWTLMSFMKDVLNLFEEENTIYILFVGLGGTTGSKLCFPILKHLQQKKALHFLAGILPWNYEGKARNAIANFAKSEIQSTFKGNVYLLNPEVVRNEVGNLPFKEAFLELDKRIYEIGIGSIKNFETT
jgi:cell division GTPase FtsZ